MPRPAGEPTLDATAPPAGRGAVSGDEVAELARQIAGVAGSGLPLPSGLDALARELPRGPLREMLGRVARRVEEGGSLDSALDAEGSRFPAPLRGLIAAGARSGKLAEAMGRFLDLNDLGHSLRRQLVLGMIYPMILAIAAAAVFVGGSFVTAYGFEPIFADFGLDLPWVTIQMIRASRAVVTAGWWLLFGPIFGAAVLWATMRLTLGPAERNRLVQGLPLIGALSRDTALAQFCPVLALLLESDVPLPEALRLAGDASRDAVMAATARAMADEVEAGRTLGEAVAGRPPFPGGFDRFLAWAQENRGLVEALGLSAETFEARARAQAAFIGRFCNVVSMVVVFWWIGLTVLALFLPLIQLMNALGGSGRGLPQDWTAALVLSGLGVLAALGVVSVIVVAWPILGRWSGSEGETAAEARDAGPRLWYFAAMGWTLVGLIVVALPVLALMNWLGGDWLPAWWKDEVWPLAQVVGIAIAIVGLLMVAAVALASRSDRTRGTGGAKAARHPVRFRVPTWRFGLRHLMFAMAPLALGFVMARDFGWSFLAVLAMLSPPIVAVSAYAILTDRRALQREGLLRVMAMAARRGQPLAPAISAFAETCRGEYRRKLVALARRLDAGDPLPEALDRVPKALSRTGEVVARVGWETGTLGRMLDDAVAASAAEKAARVVAVGSIGYPLAVIAAIAGVGAFLLLYVGPSFRRVFSEFGVPMPEPSRSIFAIVEGRIPTLPDPATAALSGAGVALSLLAAALLSRFAARRLLDAIPLGDRLMRRRHTAVILRALAAGVEAGQPLPAILGRLAAGYPRPWARSRLLRGADRVNRGEDWPSALRVEGLMGGTEAALLRSAERAGNLPWALREAADGGERRLGYRLQAAGQVLQPLVVLAMGMLVLLFALTYFRPLITLIDTLAGAEP